MSRSGSVVISTLLLIPLAGCSSNLDGDGVRAAASQAAADRAAVEALASQAAEDRVAAAAELAAAKALAEKQLAAAPTKAPAATPKAAAPPGAVTDPQSLLRRFLTAWQAGDRSAKEQLAKTMALQGFTEDPADWSEFFVDECELDGSGECGFNLVASEGGSITYLVSYSNAGRSGSLVIEEFETLGGGG